MNNEPDIQSENLKNSIRIQVICQEGEGYKIEFKEKLSALDKELVAFSNASGGSIYLGISDDGHIKPIKITNELKSQIQDIAHSCDPSIRVSLIIYAILGVLEIQVEEGMDKPYRCKEGFFLRNGASSQKLRRDEILELLIQKVRFDELMNSKFRYPQDFSAEKFEQFLRLSEIHVKAPQEEILLSLNAAEKMKDQILLSNAAVLLFAEEPQKFFPESYITGVKYAGKDRFSILDKKDFKGGLIDQIEDSLMFLSKHVAVEITVGAQHFARHQRVEEYPLIALREALINAVTHRDYFYDGSHIYIHVFSDRIEIESPGGLCHGMKIDYLGQRSVRRNRLIADFLHRAGYIERIGSGFSRMQQLLKENKNPPLKVQVSNFFNLTLYPRISDEKLGSLSARQQQILSYFYEKNTLAQKDISRILSISQDTVIRELKVLQEAQLIQKIGTGKSTAYSLKT